MYRLTSSSHQPCEAVTVTHSLQKKETQKPKGLAAQGLVKRQDQGSHTGHYYSKACVFFINVNDNVLNIIHLLSSMIWLLFVTRTMDWELENLVSSLALCSRWASHLVFLNTDFLVSKRGNGSQSVSTDLGAINICYGKRRTKPEIKMV